MLRDDSDWISLADAFHSAAIDGQGWDAALEGFATATGSAVGELVCFGPGASVPVNIVTGIDPGFQEAFIAAGGGDPRVNPRVNAGVNAPLLKSLAESDFITPDRYARDPHYQEFAIPWGIPFICAAVLERSERLWVGVAVARNQRQGHIRDDERSVFETLIPHVRAAVRMQMSLEGQGARLIAGAMEALDIAAFVCDEAGRVQALTPAAERLAAAGDCLKVRQGQLLAVNPADEKPLRDAIDAAVFQGRTPGAPPCHSVLLHEPGRVSPSLVLDVVTLPRQDFAFSFTPRVLVVVRGNRGDETRRAAMLRTACGLTAAETEIALLIAAGHSPETVAAIRASSIGTVRSQIKSVMSKLGVNRQIELAAKVNRF